MPQAAAILARDRPAAIFTTGGYVAVPVLTAARLLGIPVVLWEGNVDPGSERPGHGPAGDASPCPSRGDGPALAVAAGRVLPDGDADPRRRRRSTADAARARLGPGRRTIG